MKKVLNIALDIETLSKRPTAAIISIAAKAFDLTTGSINEGWSISINATSCAMYGLSFDQETIEWWSKRDEKAKMQFIEDARDLKTALYALKGYIESCKKEQEADEVVVWFQGTDFDIPILRNAYAVVFNDPEETVIPWKYSNVRDSRTYIIESIRAMHWVDDNPYSFIKSEGDWCKHDALSDVQKLIDNVTYVHNRLEDYLIVGIEKEAYGE